VTVHRVRVGIIGLGFGAKVQLPAFASLDGVQVVGLAGSGRSTRPPEVGAAAVSSRWQDLVSSEQVDAVSIAVPPDCQAEVACAALQAGKHVLCEKPFGRETADAARMCTEANRRGVVNAVDFEFRHEPGILLLQRCVEHGTIGEVKRIDVSWLTSGQADAQLPWSWRNDAGRGGGVLNAFASHAIDYIQWICRRPIATVLAHGRTLVPQRTHFGEARQVSAEDSADLLCELDNGVPARITVSNSFQPASGHRIEIHGSRGILVFHHEPPYHPGHANVHWRTGSGRQTQIPCEPLPGPFTPDTRVGIFRQLAGRFIAAVGGDRVENLPDFSCGLRVRQVLDAARQSIQEGRRIPCPC
jgi:predicted dehydrogenase